MNIISGPLLAMISMLLLPLFTDVPWSLFCNSHYFQARGQDLCSTAVACVVILVDVDPAVVVVVVTAVVIGVVIVIKIQ